MVIHRIAAGSPLLGDTPASLTAGEAELTLEVSGFDDVSGQPVHAQRTWQAPTIVWGARLADIMFEEPGGNLRIDLHRFHELTPTPPVPDFPYTAA
jgi:hypothetical protein